MEKEIKKLLEIADELEDGNYHTECGIISDLVSDIQADKIKTVEDVLQWLIDRNWYY